MSSADKTKDLVFAVDLGGTHLRAAAVDEIGQIRFRHKQTTPHDSCEQVVHAIVEAAKNWQDESSEKNVLSAVCVVVPGTVNIATGKVITAPNLPCLDGFELGGALQNALQLPVLIENDANAAAVGEMWQGAARGYRTIVCLTLGTGVGGGIILDGKVWHGANDTAGEIGHATVEPSGVECKCGNRGCLEVYASATAIVRMTRAAIPSHPSSMLGTESELTAEKIYRAALSGDELALEVLQSAGRYLGIGLANIVNVLNPEMIVIGGGVANAWDIFAAEMNRQISERAFPLPVSQLKIVRAECGDDAGVLGAARLAFCANADPR
ncbi:MAG TPA: ROK family protein [Pyrinomonadaceae bacterium]|nr:ROK family protein [Pyrinomonadaceae bacterium]